MLSLDSKTKKYSFKLPDCHNKLNQYGKIALSDPEKSVLQHYHRRLSKDQKKNSRIGSKSQISELSSMLLYKNSKSSFRKTNPELQLQISKLSELKLDSPRELKHIKYQGQIKIPTIHNDYHTRATNHGFSRSETGGIFPK